MLVPTMSEDRQEPNSLSSPDSASSNWTSGSSGPTGGNAQRYFGLLFSHVGYKMKAIPLFYGQLRHAGAIVALKRKFQDVLNVAQGEVPGAFATPVCRTPSAVFR
jgi:hypothetical protein